MAELVTTNRSIASRVSWRIICLTTSLGWLVLAQVARCQTPAQPAAPATASQTGTVESGQLELTHSQVYIHVGKARIGHEHAVIGKLKSGTLRLAAADNPQIEPGTLVFDLTSFDADTDAARQYIGLKDPIDDATRKQVNENMLGKDVLDVRRFPTATFVAKKVTGSARTATAACHSMHSTANSPCTA